MTQTFTVEEIGKTVREWVLPLAQMSSFGLEHAAFAFGITRAREMELRFDAWMLRPEEWINVVPEPGHLAYLFLEPGRRLRRERVVSPWLTEDEPIVIPQLPSGVIVEIQNARFSTNQQPRVIHIGAPRSPQPYYRHDY